VTEHIAPTGQLDLDHVGAEVGQERRGKRTGHHRAQIDHAQPDERAGVSAIRAPPC
jgi:hypothetical protein